MLTYADVWTKIEEEELRQEAVAKRNADVC
jgi:hypothetical protein